MAARVINGGDNHLNPLRSMARARHLDPGTVAHMVNLILLAGKGSTATCRGTCNVIVGMEQSMSLAIRIDHHLITFWAVEFNFAKLPVFYSGESLSLKRYYFTHGAGRLALIS